jgi:hypothetical protein
MESSDPRGDLTDEERSKLGRIRTQMEDASGFLDGVLGGWNHGGKEQYQRVDELAKAVTEARDAAGRLPS